MNQPLSRRAFLRLTSTVASMPLLSGCLSGDSGDSFLSRNGIAGGATTTPSQFDLASLLPTTLEQRAHDLTIRFQHIEPTFAPRGLLAAWAFNEGSGYRFRDSTGRGNDAYLTGANWNTTDSGLTATLHGKGIRGGAVLVNGSQWLQIQYKPELQTQKQFTVLMWVKPEQLTNCSLLAKGTNDYALTLAADGALHFAVGEQMVASKAGVVSPNSWQQLAATCDAEQGQLRLYHNGVLVGSTDATFTPIAGEGDLCFGGDQQSQVGLQGWLGELTLHTTALSEQDTWLWRTVGMPTIYRQTRETIDVGKTVWTSWKGNEPIPHPIEQDTVFTARYNGALLSDQGHTPQSGNATLVPGKFGGALDATKGGLRYPSPITTEQGTFEAWVIPQGDKDTDKQVLLRAEGRDGWLELASENGQWHAALGSGANDAAAVQVTAPLLMGERLGHVAVAWSASTLALFVGGVEVARTAVDAGMRCYDQTLLIGGRVETAFRGAIDDVRISSVARSWGEVCPRGHIATEAASLDLRDFLDGEAGEPLRLWRAASEGAQWTYTDGGIGQTATQGFHPLFHPDAFGHMSSVEASVSFAELHDGWAGVFVQASAPGELFSGYSFSLNPRRNNMRIAAHQHGAVIAEKTLPYDFPIQANMIYTLTLTSADDGMLRGYVDGNSMITLLKQTLPGFAEGYAGLFTANTVAGFGEVHFTALTPATTESRLIEQRVFVDGQNLADAGGYSALELNAFRWHKWHGHLPWKRGDLDPEPVGALFGPTDDVVRPNAPAAWRSEDSANSDVIAVNGTVYYFMRGNPRVGTSHGPAAIGVHSVRCSQFDGRHFIDQNADVADANNAQLLRGNRDAAPESMRDAGARRDQFQVNDHGSAYVGERSILLFAREFRNRVGANPWYRRLGFGMYNLATNAWQQSEVSYVEWSLMASDRPGAPHEGLDATPEIVALRDAENDQYTVFLFHHQPGTRIGGVSGLALTNEIVALDKRYPQRDSFVEDNGNVAYGERVLFDNGIYYLHYNAASSEIKMSQDWPDRFHLAASLHPYAQTFINSAENLSERPYFGRGEPGDFDNGAIWQGCMFKQRGRYYLYYEAYHSINLVDKPYELYDDVSAGSRAGYATAN